MRELRLRHEEHEDNAEGAVDPEIGEQPERTARLEGGSGACRPRWTPCKRYANLEAVVQAWRRHRARRARRTEPAARPGEAPAVLPFERPGGDRRQSR